MSTHRLLNLEYRRFSTRQTEGLEGVYGHSMNEDKVTIKIDHIET
jgi:hypothetical protein